MRGFQETANVLCSVAGEAPRDDINRCKDNDVILPFIMLRRLDCLLEPTTAQ